MNKLDIQIHSMILMLENTFGFNKKDDERIKNVLIKLYEIQDKNKEPLNE